MFHKANINQSIKASEEGNYSIDLTHDMISYANGSQCLIYNKEGFVSEGDKLTPLKRIQLNDTIIAAKFTTDSKKIITNDFDYRISIYDVNQSFQIEHQFDPKTLKTWKFALSPDSKTIVAGNTVLTFYDIETHSILKEIDTRLKFIYSLCFMDNTHLAVGNTTGSISIYNIESGTFTNKIEEHCLTVRAMAVNNSGNKLFSASDDLHINIIDKNTMKVVSPIVGHKDFISTLIYNEDKHMLFSASYDGTIKAWDERCSYKNITTLCEEKSNPIWDMAVSNVGDLVIYSGEEFPGAFRLV